MVGNVCSLSIRFVPHLSHLRVGFPGRGELRGNTCQPAKRTFSLKFCKNWKYIYLEVYIYIYYGTYYPMRK